MCTDNFIFYNFCIDIELKKKIFYRYYYRFSHCIEKFSLSFALFTFYISSKKKLLTLLPPLNTSSKNLAQASLKCPWQTFFTHSCMHLFIYVCTFVCMYMHKCTFTSNSSRASFWLSHSITF